MIVSTPTTSASLTNHLQSSAEFEVRHVKKQNKAVSFDVNVSVYETLNLSDYSKEDRTNCWYQPADILRGKREILETLQLLRTGRYTGDDEKHCARGLENRLRARSLTKKRQKLSAWLAVLEEQEIQRYRGIVREEAIALVYKLASRHCVEDALLNGCMDELDAYSPDSTSEQEVVDGQTKTTVKKVTRQKSWTSLSRIIRRRFSAIDQKRKQMI